MEPICKGFRSRLLKNKFVSRGLTTSSDVIDFDDIAKSYDFAVQTALIKEDDSNANDAVLITQNFMAQ
jgi:hypothetical protein